MSTNGNLLDNNLLNLSNEGYWYLGKDGKNDKTSIKLYR